MINKISAINHPHHASKINFKSNEHDNPIETKKVETSDLQAKANYGLAQLKLSRTMNLKPLKSQLINTTNPDDYEGVKVYDSEGNFAGIVNKNDKITSYYMVGANDNKINKIKVFDNKTNKLIRQETLENVDDTSYIYVEEFAPITGKKIASTNYENDKLVIIRNYSDTRNGNKVIKSYDFEDKIYKIRETNQRNNYDAYLKYSDENKQTEYNEAITKGNVKHERGVSFYEGAMISTYETKETVIPNMIGREPMEDKDLIPSKKINVNILSNIMNDSEKTYYSNGSVETATKEDMIARYNLQGDLINFETKNTKFYFYPDGSQEIHEKLGEDISKITIYDYESKSITVEYQNGDECKKLNLNNKLQPKYYEEYTITDDEKEWKKDYYYTNGSLSYVF